jgi:tetraacyldisaccharide-1-P 4'-kinase
MTPSSTPSPVPQVAQVLLHEAGATEVISREYVDHYHYSEEEMHSVLNWAVSSSSTHKNTSCCHFEVLTYSATTPNAALNQSSLLEDNILITTEKDFYRCKALLKKILSPTRRRFPLEDRHPVRLYILVGELEMCESSESFILNNVLQ